MFFRSNLEKILAEPSSLGKFARHEKGQVKMSVAAGEDIVVSENHSNYRWLQLFLGIVCMTMIANLQYGWTLFVGPLHRGFRLEAGGRSRWPSPYSSVCETWLVPFEGYFEDLFGPKPLVAFGGVLVGVAWVLNSQITGLSGLYIAQAIGGIGRRCDLRHLCRQCDEMVPRITAVWPPASRLRASASARR